MKEPNYSKRELDHYLGDLKEILVKQNVTLEEIKTQTIKTNGRVSKLEWWQGAIIWGTPILISIAIFLFNKFG
jgi:hypothetical protein